MFGSVVLNAFKLFKGTEGARVLDRMLVLEDGIRSNA
jgi:hypothetical protein